MSPALSILVVDDAADSVLSLTGFLLARKHQVATLANGKDALAAVQRRRTAGEPYDVLILEISLPGLDGLALIKELRRRHDPIEVVICTAYATIHPGLAQEAERHGCLGVVEKPADLATVESLLAQIGSRRRTAPGTSKSDQPFFGTSRIVRNDEVTTSRLRRESSAPGDGLERRDASLERREQGLERRGQAQPPAAPPGRVPSPLPFDEGSDRIPRRQVQSFSHSAPAAPATGRVEPPPAAIPLAPEAIAVPRPGEAAVEPAKPLAPVTTRLRRTVSGTERITRQAQAPPSAAVPPGSRAVGCAVCGKPFVVLEKPTGYSVVCVHCGQVNRVEPVS